MQHRRTLYAFCTNPRCDFVAAYLERTQPEETCPKCGKPINQKCVDCHHVATFKGTVCTACIKKDYEERRRPVT
jgi:hypothetical protein